MKESQTKYCISHTQSHGISYNSVKKKLSFFEILALKEFNHLNNEMVKLLNQVFIIMIVITMIIMIVILMKCKSLKKLKEAKFEKFLFRKQPIC